MLTVVLLVCLTILAVMVGLAGSASVTQAREDHAAAHRSFLAQARLQQLPPVQAGQVVRVVVRQSERQPPAPQGGPPHLDPLWLAPEVTVKEAWAVADERGRIARVVTFLRDEHGGLLGQSVVDENARMTVYDARRATTSSVSFPQRAPLDAAGGLADGLGQEPAAGSARPIRQERRADRAVAVLEHRGSADAQWLQAVARGEIKRPYAGDLRIKDRGRRFVFAQDTKALLQEVEFVVTDSGEERVLRAQEWQRVEVLDPAQVPPGVLTPAMPQTIDRLVAVPLRRLVLNEAADAVPFTLYGLASPPAGAAAPTVTYTEGQQVALERLAVQFRGLDFAVQRGDAARIVYERSARYLDLVEGPSANFAASLRQAPAFWAGARPITVQIEGAAVSGWLLTSSPGEATADPKSGVSRQIPGPQRILLPEVGGTGILLTAQGYSEEELLAVAAQLRQVR